MSDSDRVPLERLRVTREVPLWGVLSLLVSVVGSAVATYYQVQAQGERLAQVSADVKQLVSDMRARERDAEVSRLRYDELQRRLQYVEQRIDATPPRLGR